VGLSVGPAAAAAASKVARGVRGVGLADLQDVDNSSSDGSDSYTDSDTDDGLLNLDPQQQQQQQQQQPSRQLLQEQLDLLRCPQTAAAAAADVRQSMFDIVDSQPWQMEGQDPPGLACQLYRWVVLPCVESRFGSRVLPCAPTPL
jgi:hypothetical protein